MTAADPGGDGALAERIADGAAQLLRVVRGSGLLQAAALGAAGDRLAQDFIAAVLAAERPADAVLSEEGERDAGRLGRDRVWVIDPLDGTREFAEGRDDFAVHIALVQGSRAVIGAVALPGQGLLYSSASPPCLPQAPVNAILVSRTRPPPIAAAAAAALGATLLPMGSAGAKVMALLRGEARAYIHAGGQYEWDSAAPVAIAAAAGCYVARLDGAPLCYNQPDPLLPDLVVARPEDGPWLRDFLAAWRG
jgi:3'(2'), 5'-bisphosphate nucleotidase